MLTKFEQKTARVKGLCFHPKRPWLLTSLHNGSVQIWDYRMGTVVDTYTEHEGPVRGCAFHATQPLFVTCGDDNKIRVWNYQQKKCLFVLSGHQDYIRTVAFHHESPWILTASDDQTIRIWNWQNRTCVAQLTGHSHYVMCAQFHPREDLVVSASLDQTIRVWDIGHLRRKGSMTPMEDRSAGGQIDLFASSDGHVKFIMEGHDRGVNWVQFHPTKPMIVSGSDDRSVKLWRYNESRAWETDTFRGHFNNVSCVLFHPTADLLLSASEDKTLRVWDYSKRGAQAQTFRRENDRYWMVGVHPSAGVFAAGHDSGFQVFKLERERPPQVLLDDSLFVLKGAQLVRRDLSGNGGETSLVTLSAAPSLPATIDYSSSDKSFLIGHGGEYELVSRTSKKGLGKDAHFWTGGRFIVLDTEAQTIHVKSVGENATVQIIPCPIPEVQHAFAAPDDCVLLTSATSACLLDLNTQALLVEMAMAQVRRVAWSPDQRRCALMSRKGISLVDRTFTPIATANEPVPVKSGVWDPAGIFFYTTPHHLKYMLPSGETGIVRTLDDPLYLVRVRGAQVHGLDRHGALHCLAVDPAEYVFKLALLEGDLPRVLTIIQQSSLVGQAVISYLRQHGYAALALEFVEDPAGRFELALESANWAAAEEAAEVLGQVNIWETLAAQALKLGNHTLAKKAYARAGNHAQLLLLSACTGDMSQIPSDDPSIALQSLMLRGDGSGLAKQLEALGLHSLAYLAHRQAGTQAKLPAGVTEADLKLEGPCGQLKGVRTSVPLSDEPWPMAQPLCQYEAAPIASALVSPMVEDEEAIPTAAGGWDTSAEILPINVQEEDDYTEFAAVNDNPLLASRVPALHLLAGSIDSARRLMNQEAGVIDFGPLEGLFEEAALRSSLGSLVNRFEDVQPVVTAADLSARLETGMQLTTAGKFSDALASFEWVLHAALFTVLSPSENIDALLEEARHYIIGLRMELKRKELLASSPGELNGDVATRVLELACYFTCCPLRPEHLVLALRSAMTLAFKTKQLGLAGRMARRLIDARPDEAIAQQAQKVLALATKSNTPPDTLPIDFDDHLHFDLDAATFKPIYPTAAASALACPLCGALYGPDAAGHVCSVCRVAAVGAPATGLHLHP